MDMEGLRPLQTTPWGSEGIGPPDLPGKGVTKGRERRKDEGIRGIKGRRDNEPSRQSGREVMKREEPQNAQAGMPERRGPEAVGTQCEPG